MLPDFLDEYPNPKPAMNTAMHGQGKYCHLPHEASGEFEHQPETSGPNKALPRHPPGATINIASPPHFRNECLEVERTSEVG